MKFGIEAILSFVFGSMFVFGLLSSWGWPSGTRFFTLSVAVPGLLLSLASLVVEIKKGSKGRETATHAGNHARGGMEETRRRTATIFGWILGLFLLIRVLGFELAVPLFTFLYLKFQAKENLILSSSITFLMVLIVVGLFDFVLNVPWPKSLIEAVMP